jgi:hypothetical protein
MESNRVVGGAIAGGWTKHAYYVLLYSSDLPEMLNVMEVVCVEQNTYIL